MKFWDTSAIVSLCVTEPASATLKSILSRDASVVVWWATRTECVSAFMRQSREGGLSRESERQARQVLGLLTGAWTEVQPSETLRATAERLLAVHPLRAADAFQLGAALHWCQRQTTNKELVSFDTRLRAAGHKEGFTLLPSDLR
ncbi:MAG TPA: type II toxin-antitoxin system VapC family toxin [Candidatus Udaeobacter sp.]|nr:type II toxin-antitoxin system VapC family toxin [Candidatus Udaeobacter sp.]